ncbi:MAG: TraB/GumN family protein [Crocinitomix sp.]|nr:TraB/GumN family protein [Crocinitomix sp.]
MFNKIFAALLCILGITSAFAQDNNSMLWSVSGNGLKDTSYLYGTIHMLCESDFVVKAKVKQAFNKSEQLFLEIDMDDEKEMQAMMASVNGEKPLTEILTPEQQKRLDEKLQTDLGMNLQAVNSYSLNTITALFAMNSLSCEQIKSYEQEFITMAQKNEIEVKGLEKVAFQLECLNQSASTEKTFTDIFAEENAGVLDSLVSLYTAEDFEGMQSFFSQSDYMDANSREWLLVKRNNNWIKKMPKIMKKKPTFFAVGAAHLLDEIGLVAQLQKLGYTVSPIFQ